ncbi:hypothetical protein OCV73_02540 [Barnesiella propionica]|uniref:hypothetical protein n=1 Tax=Barnesiella propionica TaxID=2981781 RepID=UPI0011C867B9|nr:hypothetical protein [Barnesiella propionica]MCU6767836.1 hypothetical protein [Barnesiella propionica]
MANVDNNTVKSKRDLALERMKGKYPDKNFDDEDLFFGQINDDYDDYDKQIAGYKEREGKFSEMFTSDPRSANFIMNWKNGEDPAIGLIRQFGTEIKEVIDDPERQEEIAAANQEFIKRVAKEKELDETYQKNLAESLSVLDSLQQNEGMSDEEIDNAMEFLITIVRDGVMGKFTPESIKMAMKAIKHDVDVEQAIQEGELKGKNTKIEEKLRANKKTDGTAQLDGKNGHGGERKSMPNLGALDQFGEGNQSIWERGGEKRRKTTI